MLTLEWKPAIALRWGVVILIYLQGMKKYGYQQNLQKSDLTKENLLSPETWVLSSNPITKQIAQISRRLSQLPICLKKKKTAYKSTSKGLAQVIDPKEMDNT
jgi:hypothetical protein